MGYIMNIHRIHRVAKLTGLTKDVIRVWERRYGLLKPIRGANRYRNYSDEDVLLLRFLKQEQERGYSIGDLAELGRDELLARARQSALPARSPDSNPYARLIEQLIQSLDPLDKTSFERKLNGAVAIVPFDEALHGMLIPLQQRVGGVDREQARPVGGKPDGVDVRALEVDVLGARGIDRAGCRQDGDHREGRDSRPQPHGGLLRVSARLYREAGGRGAIRGGYRLFPLGIKSARRSSRSDPAGSS